MESFGNRITHRKFHSLERGSLNNKCDSANTWPWFCITKGCWEAEEDIFKTFQRQRRLAASLISAFAQALVGSQICHIILENPTEVFTRVVTIYERKRHNQGNSKSIIFYLIQEYRPNMLIECPTKTLQCLTSLFMIIPCDVNSSQNARVFCDALFKNE